MVVIVNFWVSNGFILMYRVSDDVVGIGVIGVSNGSGVGIRLGFDLGESTSGIGISCKVCGI